MSQALYFYVIGSDFTRILRDLAHEGQYHLVEQTMKEGGILDTAYIKAAMLGQVVFEGDSREGDLDVQITEQPYDIQSEFLTDALFTVRTTISRRLYDTAKRAIEDLQTLGSIQNASSVTYGAHGDETIYEFLKNPSNRHHKELSALFRYFTEEEIEGLLCIERRLGVLAGYHATHWRDYKPDYFQQEYPTGVITQRGYIIECGHQQHKYLFDELMRYGLTGSDWYDTDATPAEQKILPFSAGSYYAYRGTGGLLSNPEDFAEDTESFLTEDQLQAMWRIRDKVKGYYSSPNIPVATLIADYYNKRFGMGGKLAHLLFLKKFMARIDLFQVPEFDKEYFTGADCIRSSPTRSMPGVLNSYFGLISQEDAMEAMDRMREDWVQVPDDQKWGNNLGWFFQKSVVGANGVAHWMWSDMTYALSDTRGDVVAGGEGKVVLSRQTEKSLRNLMEDISREFESDMQVEFVLTPEDTIMVVQARRLRNVPPEVTQEAAPWGAIQGMGFSPGDAVVSLEKVLVVDRDCEPGTLLDNVDAVIVRRNVAYSHVLALAMNKGIPAIYGIGDQKLPEKFRIYTKQRFAWIQNIES